MSRVQKGNAIFDARFATWVLVIASTGLSATQARAAEGDKSFEVYGFAQADYIQDFKRVNPAWDDTLRPSRIPTIDGLFGSDGQAMVSVKQSRLGAQGTLPVMGQNLFAKVEFDFFGVGVDEGQTTIRLRHAYGQWGQFLAGQTNSLFMDGDIFPNTIDYWGPTGMVFYRTPQIRWMFYNSKGSSAAVAIEKPGSDIDAGNIRELDPGLGDNLQGNEKLPDLTAQYRYTGNWGHFQIAGILRDVGYDSPNTLDNRPKGEKMGWGIDLTSVIKTNQRDKLLLGLVFGQGIASYMNDGGMDLAPEVDVVVGVNPLIVGPLPPPLIHAKAVPLVGVSAYYDHYWNDMFSTSLGYSRTQVDNTNFQAGNAYQHGDYASINLLYTPNPKTLIGAEFLWGEREDNDHEKGEDYRLQISFKYSFTSKDFFTP